MIDQKIDEEFDKGAIGDDLTDKVTFSIDDMLDKVHDRCGRWQASILIRSNNRVNGGFSNTLRNIYEKINAVLQQEN